MGEGQLADVSYVEVQDVIGLISSVARYFQVLEDSTGSYRVNPIRSQTLLETHSLTRQ
jgi:hypothetical protein